ncbi:hypothetical protein GCM10010298_76330 [Streptomyces microflavus]|uniref:Uncharacterized protein n=1 Tax=Streptomyces microflavus TaxID=1919 RepID=A0A7J0D615_STRMI|nr:hypothetical protein Smic_87460 [Streptomyces microflavus]GGX99973.1 hypothetical protein GCM10010298_76330 [Streptomyces microflavus]
MTVPNTFSPELSCHSAEFFGLRCRKGAGGERREARVSSDLEKPRRKWTSAESAQVWLTVVGILVAIIALVGQFVQHR